MHVLFLCRFAALLPRQTLTQWYVNAIILIIATCVASHACLGIMLAHIRLAIAAANLLA